MIDRFSEDIDLTIGRDALSFGGENSPEQAPSARQRAKRLKALKVACSEHVGTVVLLDLQERMGAIEAMAPWSMVMDDEDPDAQTILLRYPSHFDAPAARYVSPVVKIEVGARSDPWPMRERMVRPVMADYFSQALEESDAIVHALAPERTFWEKRCCCTRSGFGRRINRVGHAWRAITMTHSV